MTSTDRNARYLKKSIDGSLTSLKPVDKQPEEACLVATTKVPEPFHDEHFQSLGMRDYWIPHDASSNVEGPSFSATPLDQAARLHQPERSPEPATPRTTSVKESHCPNSTEDSPEDVFHNDPDVSRRPFAPDSKSTQPSSPGSKYERPSHHHFPPMHGHPHPFYYPYYPPPPPPVPTRKPVMSATMKLSSAEQNDPDPKAPSEEKRSHPNHLPLPPYPWPYPPHQMYFYPPPPYYPPPSNDLNTTRKEKKKSPTRRDRSEVDAAPAVSSESPPKQKRKSSEPPIQSEKLSAIKEQAHDVVLKDQKKNEGVPSTVLEKRARKNAQSRLRAAKLKEKIARIQAKEPSERTPEEASTLAKFEDRRQRKNGRSRERAIQRKEEFERIFSKPENLWTEEEKAFMVNTMVAKYKKNEGDRLRRKKMKSDGTYSESFEDDSSSIASSTVRSLRKIEVDPPRPPPHFIPSNVYRLNGSQFRTKQSKASLPSQSRVQLQSPRPEANKTHNDDLLRIPLTPNVPLTPILGNITLQHDGSTPDYGKMFDVTPLHDGSLRECMFDSKHSEAQVVATSLELTGNSLLSNADMANTPRTPNNQKSLPFIHLTSPLNLSPLHLPRRQKMNDGLYDSLTGFGNEYHAHENQDKIAVSFSVDSNCDGKFADH